MANQSNDWNTPPELLEPIRDYFKGVIDLDPCSNDLSQVKATVEYKLPYKNGLNEPWSIYSNQTTCVFFNPPYAPYYYSEEKRILQLSSGRLNPTCDGIILNAEQYDDAGKPDGYKRITIGDWVGGARLVSGEKVLSIGLIPARGVGNRTWQRIIWPKADAICFLNKRYPFWENGKPAPNSGTFDLALLYFGAHKFEFRSYFSRYGHVVVNNE